MRSYLAGLIGRLRGRASLRVVATTLVTALSLALIGGFAVLTTTSLGCGPAAKLGLKGVSSHCKTTAYLVPLASPTPTPTAFPLFSPAAAPSPIPIPSPTPEAPGPVPVSGPGAPYIGPASSALPPFVLPVSGNSNGPTAGYPLNCRLPVYAGQAGSGGFIQFPGGNFIPDPSSAVVLPSPGQSPPPPAMGPGYQYYFGLSYDRAYSRWLPVQYTSVSPDGSRYAFAASDGVYVVDVATNSETELGGGHAWTIVGVQAQGVYASMVNQGGLWLLPFSGTAQQITSSGFWQAVSATAAYGTVTSAVPQGVVNTIIRLDLKTRAVSNWFSRQWATSLVRGLDPQGNPVIDVNFFAYPGGGETWIAKGPTADPIFGTVIGLSDQGPPLADGNGTWFTFNYNPPNGAYSQGVALYVPGSGLYWMSSYGVNLAGACS